MVAVLPVDDCGRRSVTAAARADLGWPPGTDLMISHDPDRRTLDICATSLVEPDVIAALHRLKQQPTWPPTSPPRTATGRPAPDESSDGVNFLSYSYVL